MTKKEFIEKVLKDKSNTVFVNEEQVEVVIKLFEKLGMKPPRFKKKVTHEKYGLPYYDYVNEWSDE